MRSARSQRYSLSSSASYSSHTLLVSSRSLVDVCIDVDLSFAFDDDSLNWLNSLEFSIRSDSRRLQILWLSIFATSQNELVLDSLREFLRLFNDDCIIERFDDFVDVLKNFLMSESFSLQRRREQNIEDCFRLILAISERSRDRIRRSDHSRNLNRDADE